MSFKEKDLINYGIIGAVLVGLYSLYTIMTNSDTTFNAPAKANVGSSCGCGK